MSRNVVLVTVDSLRADHCNFLAPDGPGGDHRLTPTLDDLARESVVFERAFAPGPRTPSSMPAIFTGEFVRPSDLGVYESWDEKSTRWRARRQRIADHMQRFRTLAERLQDRGYATAGVTANPWTTAATNFDTGFDAFHAVEAPDRGWTSWYSGLTDGLGDAVGIDWGDVLLTWTDFYDTVSRAHDALSEPYFLWVFLLDPHQPYIAPRRYRAENTGIEMLYANARYNYAHGYTESLPPHLDRRLRRAYRDTVRSVDGFVDRLRTDVAGDDPVTIIHADHGEAFQEHGTLGHRPQLYRENVHVPLLVHGLGTTERVEAPVSLSSIPALVTASADDSLDPTAYAREFVRSKTEEGERVGVRGRRWAYQSAAEEWEYVYDGDSEELYRVQADPEERENVVESYPAVTDTFRTLLARHETDQRERDRVSAAAVDLANRTSPV